MVDSNPTQPVNTMTPQADKPDLKQILKTVFIMILLMIVTNFGIGIFGSIIAGFIYNYYVYDAFLSFVTFLQSVAGGIVAIIYGTKALHLNIRKLIDFKQFSWKWFGKGLTMHYSASFIGNIILVFINLALAFFNTQIDDVTLESASGLSYILNFLAVVVVAAICEEVVFRGLICNALARYNRGFAVIASALLFAMAHMNLDQGIPAFIIGLSLGFIYMRSGSLVVTIAIHAVNNFIALTLSAMPYGILADILGILVLFVVALGIYYWVKERNELDAMIHLCGRAKKEWTEFVHCRWFWVWIVLFILFAVLPVIGAILVYILW
ncbi:MAG: type II CAAX prenyl endopeptidase Rce1 family protein [Allobaculum sp.]